MEKCGLFVANHGKSCGSDRVGKALHGRSNVFAAIDAIRNIFEKARVETVYHNRLFGADRAVTTSSRIA